MFIALVGTPVAASKLSIYSCEIEGNAEAKSNSTKAPLLLVSAVVIAAYSMSTTFLSMERCGRNPCCCGLIHGLSSLSQRNLAALAISLLSVLTVLRGRVLSGRKVRP